MTKTYKITLSNNDHFLTRGEPVVCYGTLFIYEAGEVGCKFIFAPGVWCSVQEVQRDI